MTNPIKMTSRQVRRLEKNLGAPAAHNTSADISFVERILWDGWELGKGRRRTVDDVEKLRVPMLNIAKRYVAEMQKKSKQ